MLELLGGGGLTVTGRMKEGIIIHTTCKSRHVIASWSRTPEIFTTASQCPMTTLSKMCCHLFSCRVESLSLSLEALFFSNHLLALSPNPLLPNLKGRHFPKDAQSFTLLLPESCNVDLTPVLMSKRLKTWE